MKKFLYQLIILCQGVVLDIASANEGYLVRAIPGLSFESKVKLTESALPLWRVVENESKTIGQLVDETCGVQDTEFRSFLIEKAVELNLLETANVKIEPNLSVAIPFCQKIVRDFQYTVAHGDSLALIAKENTGLEGDKTLSNILRLNKDVVKPTKEDFVAYSKSLRIGDTVTLPYSASNAVFVASVDNISPVQILTERLPADYSVQALEYSVKPIHEPQNVLLKTVGFITSTSASATNDCPGSGSVDLHEPYDHTRLMETLERELNKLNLQDKSAAQTTVGIIDTGLKTVGDSFFKEKYFVVNEGESGVNSSDGIDNEGNEHKDDIWGSNVSREKDGVIVTYGGDRSSHGTKMASLVLGGFDYVNELNTPHVQLRVVNFSSRIRDDLEEPTKLGSAVRYLDEGNKPEATIINLSLETSYDMLPIRRVISTFSKTLFVVAAGNNPAGGQDLSTVNVYPARLSGNHDFAANLITVASHNHSGEHAKHSNWGVNADIHAPGCAIKTIDESGNTVSDTGSSVATANVSFIAGLVRAIGGDNMRPDKIKKRLIVSADIVPRLEGKSWTRARLNPIKAISLQHDVIETFGDENYLFTSLADKGSLKAFCGEDSKREKLNNILKITPNLLNQDGDIEVEYWIDAAFRPAKITCSQTNSSLSVGILKAEDGNEKNGPKISEVKDFVAKVK